MFTQIKRGDGLFVWLNLLSLLFVTFLPATTVLLGQYPGTFIAVICFTANVIMIQLTALWVWRHASRHGLINPALDSRVVSGIGRRLSMGAAAFAVSVVFALFSIAIVYIVWIGLFIVLFVTDWLSWEQTLRVTRVMIPLDGAGRGRVAINHGAGLLRVAADATENVLAQGSLGGSLDPQIARNGDLVEARLQVSKKLGFMNYRYPWAWGPANTLDWNVSLNPHVPLELDIKTGADQVELDLTQAHITALDLETSGSSTELTLPANAGHTTVHIQAKGASLDIHVPSEVAARIHSTNSMANVEVDLKRFSVVKDGISYISNNYDTAANRVEIQLELAASFVKFI